MIEEDETDTVGKYLEWAMVFLMVVVGIMGAIFAGMVTYDYIKIQNLISTF